MRNTALTTFALATLLHWAPALAQDVGGPFSLTDVAGNRVTDEDLLGKPYALFFGFTHCPEVCPLALSEISFALSELGEEAEDLTAVFVTVDPERDTPEHLGAYLGAFDERILGLHGTPEETAAVARAFRATYRKVPLSDGDYTVDHTAIIYLMDSEGAFFDKVDYREDYEVQVEKYRRLLANE